MSAFGCKADMATGGRNASFRAATNITGRLPLSGTRASASLSFATSRRVGHGDFPRRVGHGGFTQPGHEFAELRESRDYEDQRKSAANDPDRNLNRKRICDADGVAKNVDQPFHVVSPGGVEGVAPT